MQYGFTTQFKNEILKTLMIDEGQPSEVPVELPLDPTTGYARAEIIFSEPNNGIIQNSNQVMFNQAITNWTSDSRKIYAIGIFNSPSEDFADSCLIFLPLSELEEVLAGETFSLNPNSIRLQLA